MSRSRSIARALFATLLAAVATSPLSAQILPPGAAVAQLATGYNFTEGPLADGASGVLFTNLTFGNINGSDILRHDLTTGQTVVVDGASGGANGLFRDAAGHVIAMEGGRQRVTRRSLGDVAVVEEVLASEWNGANFNSPNDVVLDASGGVYFTDPDYNNQNEQPEGVYYISPQGVVDRVASGINRPNGIALSPDGRTLYVAGEGAVERRVHAFDIEQLGTPSNQRVFVRTDVDADGDPLPNITAGPDGMTVDPFGNLYAAVQGAVFAWNPEGERLFDLPVPGRPTNVTLGGPEGETLFVTSSDGSLYSVELDLPELLAGDFNRDGAVDAADYTVLRDHFGFGYRASDYQAWLANYGAASSAKGVGVAVPEAATGALGLIGVAAHAAAATRARTDLAPGQ